jgi:hypothetical protein
MRFRALTSCLLAAACVFPVALAAEEPGPDVPPPVVTPPDDPPAAETVPLPAVLPPEVSPDKPPAGVAGSKTGADEALALIPETPVVKAGDPVVFSLYGAETFLNGAAGHYVVIDDLGREILRAPLAVKDVPFAEGKPRQIQIRVSHPLARQHTLRLSLTGLDGRQVELAANFSILRPETWDGWIVLSSIPPATGNWADLRALGVHGAMQYRMHPARREAIRKGSVPFYVENVARQQLSRYHTEAGLWEKTIASVAAKNEAALARNPSLCSRSFAELYAGEIKRHGEAYAAESPLFYSLAAEPSVTRLAAAVDFDFSPEALREFQRWLERDVYGTLPGLNAAWGTQFNTWAEVVPMTTDEARARLRDAVLNFGPWVDFRAFQDFTFSKALRGGGEILRQADARAKVGITGAMGPFAFGGWDYSGLSQALDVIECYDIGCARALWRDLAPGKPALATLALAAARDNPPEAATAMRRAIWRLALEGAPRGLLLWDEKPAEDSNESLLLGPGGFPTAVADALSPTLRELDAGTGRLLANCERQHEGVAVLYSPASVRVNWLLEAQHLHGDKWLQAWGADTSAERRESVQLRLRESWSKLLDDIGVGWRFISSKQLEEKLVLKLEPKIKIIVLPRAVALSDAEVSALKRFVEAGGRVLADAACGRFDEHGKLRAKPALDEIFGIDSSAEPLWPGAMNPLDSVRPLRAAPELDAELGTDWIKHLPPVFSDEPKHVSREKTSLLDYRGSPVCASAPAGVYLNLDLSGYLNWRLHPDQPRAQVTRALLRQLVFKETCEQAQIDWTRTRLPVGMQLTWLRPKGVGEGAQLLALLRNPQDRLHELGGEGDGNWAFEKNERFTIALRQPRQIALLRPQGKAAPGLVDVYEGELPPDEPVILALSPKPAQAPSVECAPAVRVGEPLEVRIKPADASGCYYDARVLTPGQEERACYHFTGLVAGGAAGGEPTLTIPFALNDAPGKWTLVVRDLCGGTETRREVGLQPLEK